ncbi:hypothetical protein ABPG72_011581 [Tetrahymena utriculariae]
MKLNLSFEEFCSQNNLIQVIVPPPPHQNEENLWIKINNDQKAPYKKCISNEIYNILIDFFSKQNKYQLISAEEFDKNIQHLNGNVIEGIIETYRQNGLDIMKIINQNAYQIREIELEFILYLTLYFAKDVVQQNTLKCEVRAYRVRYLYNFKNKTNYGRVYLCYSTFKYGSFKIELKSLSPSDYCEYRDSNNNKRIQINKTMHMRLSLKCGSISTLDQLLQIGLYQAQSYKIENTTSMVVVLLRSTEQSQLIYSTSKHNLPDIQDLSQPLHTIKEELLPQITDIMNSTLIQIRLDHVSTLSKVLVNENEQQDGKVLLQYDIQAELAYLQLNLDTMKLREKQENELKKANQKQKRLLLSFRCNNKKPKQKSQKVAIKQTRKSNPSNTRTESHNSSSSSNSNIIMQTLPQNKKGVQQFLQQSSIAQQLKQPLIQHFFTILNRD